MTDIYNRHRYDEEARLAISAWGTRLDEIVAKKPAKTNVVNLSGAREAAS